MSDCIHRFSVDSMNVGTCSICGEVRQFPWEKDGQLRVLKVGDLARRSIMEQSSRKQKRRYDNLNERHHYFESHKDEIMSDLLTLGGTMTRKKWGIPSSTLVGLEKRWQTNEQRATIPVSAQAKSQYQSPHPSNGQLPKFPDFSNSWDAQVQVTWIETYKALILSGEGRRV